LFCEAEIARWTGELLLAKNSDIQESEQWFHEALEIARRQNAKSLELRAASSLSRLYTSQNRKHEARQLLQGIYGWFTEGFDTTDLKDAHTLLASLT
jgi:predicted ATPase